MKKNIFNYAVVAIQACLLICFIGVIINNLPRSWKLEDSINIINPSNNKSDTMQASIAIKSFKANKAFGGNSINDSHVTSSLAKLHTAFVCQHSPDVSMNFDVVASSANMLCYKIFNKTESWVIAVSYDKSNLPRIAILSKEAVQ